jgi:hypothetical protein
MDNQGTETKPAGDPSPAAQPEVANAPGQAAGPVKEDAPPQKVIRIVPLFGHEQAFTLGPGGPQLTYRGGALLTAVQIYTVFWGNVWNTKPDLVTTANKLNDFFKYIVTSPLLTAMGEYGVTGQPIGFGSFLGTTHLKSPTPKKSIKDADLRHLLTNAIGKGSLPQPTANTLYFVYTPPGSQIIDGHDRSCSQFCGYHDQINRSIFYAAMPYPGCSGCLGGMDSFDALTGTSSHELCEAITDAVPGEGWYDDRFGEIGDICAWKFHKLNDYTVQLEWSNKANNCR